MLTTLRHVFAVTTVAATFAGSASGCSDSDSSGTSGGKEDGGSATPGDANTPPMGTPAEIDAWLAKGDYKQGAWKCEPAVRDAAATGSSPHGKVRVCSNSLASSYNSGAFPAGAASVKELYLADGRTPNGFAVSLKAKAGSEAGTWYWYDKVGTSVVANGKDVALCTSCHSKAGTAGNTGGDHTFIVVK